MERYYFNSQEVFVGKPFTFTFGDSKFGISTSTTIDCITQSFMDSLVREGLVTKKTDIRNEVKEAVSIIAKKLGTSVANIIGFVEAMGKHYPYLIFNMLSKELAIILDKKYEKHIKTCSELYEIDTDGSINLYVNVFGDIDTSIPYFRTYKDAETAKKAIIDLLGVKVF